MGVHSVATQESPRAFPVKSTRRMWTLPSKVHAHLEWRVPDSDGRCERGRIRFYQPAPIPRRLSYGVDAVVCHLQRQDSLSVPFGVGPGPTRRHAVRSSKQERARRVHLTGGISG
jgi:hypothetical protein